MKLNCKGLLPLIFAATMAANAMPLVNVSLQDSHSTTVVSADKPGGGPRETFNT
jgi:hypothetical protein